MATSARTHTGANSQDFDLEDLIHIEQTFYAMGYRDGYAHGRLHGLIEGRTLGAEKGFELWEELGFYEGAARLWTAVSSSSTDVNGTDRRSAHHASTLLALIECFPRKNPHPDEEGIDMSAQLRLIRSRYKAMCASLGSRRRPQQQRQRKIERWSGHLVAHLLLRPHKDSASDVAGFLFYFIF
ncbi:hypothetical protein B0F90DRAFT_1725753 [Multifurca ochricompacta]|uniref:Essential protein Yae1 N-terminal domain-containing protein n=1 Tax=Multifurca ochricompacta TaxID=376703 RepID=A0AAD4M519_9AGAM|nr:hypothetical protein B0F90DRAFT_1725753 [Multifurca ochricompacta]